MKAVIGTRPRQYDATVVDVPWRTDVTVGDSVNNEKRLRLGVLAEDPMFPLHPPVRKALDDAVRRLQADGHEMVFLSADECRVSHAMQVAMRMFDLDDTPNKVLAAGDEESIPGFMCMVHREGDMDWDFVSRDLDSCESGLEKLSVLNGKRKEVAETWRKLWKTHGIDAVIGPAAQNTAVEHDQYGFPPYTVFLNVLDVSRRSPLSLGRSDFVRQYPACVMPFGRAVTSDTDDQFQVKTGQTAPPCMSFSDLSFAGLSRINHAILR